MSQDSVERALEISNISIDEKVLREIVTATHASASKNPKVTRAIWPEIAARYVSQKNLPFSSVSEMMQIKRRLANRWNHLK